MNSESQHKNNTTEPFREPSQSVGVSLEPTVLRPLLNKVLAAGWVEKPNTAHSLSQWYEVPESELVTYTTPGNADTPRDDSVATVGGVVDEAAVAEIPCV
jgi:hypothetical protein